MMTCYRRVLINGTWWINIEAICHYLGISVVDQRKWILDKNLDVKTIFGQMHIEEMYSVGWIIMLTNIPKVNVDDVMSIHAMIYEHINYIPC